MLSIFLLTVLQFLPVLSTIRKERAEALKLFLFIPRNVLSKVYESFLEKDSDTDNEQDLEVQPEEQLVHGSVSASLPIATRLTINYMISLAMMSCLTTAMFVICKLFTC